MYLLQLNYCITRGNSYKLYALTSHINVRHTFFVIMLLFIVWIVFPWVNVILKRSKLVHRFSCANLNGIIILTFFIFTINSQIQNIYFVCILPCYHLWALLALMPWTILYYMYCCQLTNTNKQQPVQRCYKFHLVAPRLLALLISSCSAQLYSFLQDHIE